MKMRNYYHRQRIKFEKLSAVDLTCTESGLISGLESLGYQNESAIHGAYPFKCFYKGGLCKHYILISDSDQNLVCQYECAEEAAGEILKTEKRKITAIVVVCFAGTSCGCKRIFEKYLKFDVAVSSIFGINQIRPVVYDKKEKKFIFNNYACSSYSHYNKTRKIIVNDIIGKSAVRKKYVNS